MADGVQVQLHHSTQGLGDLFKPPHELMFPLSMASLDEAVDACLKNNKWLVWRMERRTITYMLHG